MSKERYRVPGTGYQVPNTGSLIVQHPKTNKRLGQHFLQPPWADRLADAIQPRREDRFLEIGPGPGALTLRLAPRVAQLTAVELDPRMVADLRPRVPANVTVIQQDILE